MLKDITIGQYFPLDSPIHKTDPRTKIIFTLVYIVLIFFAESIAGYLTVALFCFFVVFISKVKFRTVFKAVKPLLFIIFFTALINVFFTGGEEILFEYKFIKITQNGVVNAVSMALRLIFLVIGSSLLTYTTSPIQLTDGIERLLRPFSKIGLPSHELAMMMTISLRFIPTLLEETEKIMMAQKARGAELDNGNIFSKAKALVPILIPLFISAFRRADELATAMECRCYRGGIGRTRLRELRYTKYDLIALIFMTCFTTAIILYNIFGI